MKHKVMGAAFLASALFVVGGWAWAYAVLRNTTQPLIIHFNSEQGITRIGNFADLTAIGILGIVIVIVNCPLAFNLEERDRFLGKLVTAATLFLSILIFIGFAAIINVN